jgi:hypothetical protein
MEKLFPKKRSRLSELIVHSPWRYPPTTRDLYEPIMNQVGVSGGIVKHGGLRPILDRKSTSIGPFSGLPGAA